MSIAVSNRHILMTWTDAEMESPKKTCKMVMVNATWHVMYMCTYTWCVHTVHMVCTCVVHVVYI
jgi:hypothetical protein